MKRFPVFVEARGRQVAAVVTVPEEPPRGIVISLVGIGRHNLIGSTLCAQLSERVVEHGLASIRLDYSGSGDSPGLVPTWTLSDVDAVVDEARAVLSVASEALHVDRFAVVGTCYGSRVALSLVSDPSCTGAICLGPPVLEHGGLSRLSRRVGERTILSYVRSNALLRRMARPLRRLLRARKAATRVVGAFGHLDRARIVFLYGKDPTEDHYSRRGQEVIDASLAMLSTEQKARFDLRVLPWGPLTTFDILSPADQEAVLEVVVPLVDATFEDTSSPRPGAAAVAG